MLKASVFIATSVDGFIARQDGSIDWLPADGGEDHGYTAFMATVDALVMGRHTYETVLGFGSWPFGAKPVFVLSSKPLQDPGSTLAIVEAMSGDPHEIAASLTARGYRHIYVDGGITVQRFLRAGLIQEMTITRVPCLIGTGIPLFGSLPHDIRLRHQGTTTYPSGLVTSVYHIDA